MKDKDSEEVVVTEKKITTETIIILILVFLGKCTGIFGKVYQKFISRTISSSIPITDMLVPFEVLD
jgi:hypothetical protein